MNTIKFIALAAVAFFAGLYLQSVPDSQRIEAPGNVKAPVEVEQAPAKPQPSGYRDEPALAAVPDTDGSPPPAPEATEPSASPPVATQSIDSTQPIDWLRILYPELSRISELENEPAAMALAELVPMLASDDPAVRMAAVESAGDMTLTAALPMLSAALDDPDPRVRVTALEALATRDDESVSGNIEPYLYDQEPEVRMAAIDALATLEAKTAVSALAGLLSDPAVSIRRRAVDALGDIGGEEAMQYLLQARYDPNESVRFNADSILAELNY